MKISNSPLLSCNYFYSFQFFNFVKQMDEITDIQLFKTLRKKLGENEAEELVPFVRSAIDAKLNEQIPHLATKKDLAEV